MEKELNRLKAMPYGSQEATVSRTYLDVLLELCDRILVLCGGQVSGVVDARTATKEQIGLLMTRLGGKEGA